MPPVPVNMNTVEIQPSTSSKTINKTDPFEISEVPPIKAPPLPPRSRAPPPLPPRPNLTPRSDPIEKSKESAPEVMPPILNGNIKSEKMPEKPKTLQMTRKVSPPSTSNSGTLEPAKHFLYQELISKTSLEDKNRFLDAASPLWSNMVFWEVAFFDMVAKERDIIGMDQGRILFYRLKRKF
jgi:hypothetical protein